MGRIVTKVTVANYAHPDKELRINALVDTAAAHLTLPSQWRSQLGELESLGQIEVQLADQSAKTAEVCGPVRVTIGSFRPIFCEVLFLDMDKDDDEEYEPLLGYIPLEAANAEVDMMGHRLIHLKRYDLK